MLGVTFMVKLVNGDIDSKFLLSQLHFNVPMRPSRQFVPLKLSLCKFKYQSVNPVNRLSKLYNEQFKLISSTYSITLIKRAILNLPNNC